jgi:hypothetical protein
VDYQRFIQLTDTQRIILVEVQPAHAVESLVWTQHDTYTNLYSTPYAYGIADKVEENGTEYIEAFSLSEANTTPSSFFYDLSGQILYLHTSNSDSPGKQTNPPVYDYTILVYFWRYFSSSQPKTAPIVFPRKQAQIKNGGVEVWEPSGALSNWQKVQNGGSVVEKESTSPHSGGYCVKLAIDEANSYAGIQQSFRLPLSVLCKLSLYYKTTGGATGKIEIKDSADNIYLKSDGSWSAEQTTISLSATTNWAKFELEFTSHDTYTDYIISLGSESAASQFCFFDDAQIFALREDNYYLPYITTSGIADLQQAIAPFYDTAMVMEFGTVQFTNDGWWYEQIQNYFWNLKKIVIKYGDGSESTLETIFYGFIRTPQVSDLLTTIEVVDNKVYTYKSVPDTFFSTDTYPNLESGADGKPIPIIYGEFGTDNDDPFDGIVPTKVDSATYLLAAHALEAVTAVYSNGQLQTEDTDYTVDLDAATVTFTSDPGAAFITCKVKGKKCSMIDGTYSQNVVDFLYDLLVNYCGISPEELALDTFLQLRAVRTQFHHLYINSVTPVLDTIRLLQISALFYLISRADTKLAVVYFRSQDTPLADIQNEDTEQFSYEKDVSGVFSTIKLNYGYLVGEGVYQTISQENPSVGLKYKEVQTLELTTSLRRKEDATDLLSYYAGITVDPLIKVSVKVPSKAFNLYPGSKITISKKRTLEAGGNYDVLVAAPFRILSLTKELRSSKVSIVGLDDLQVSGGGICEVCYACQLCYTVQTGTCSSCYSCQECYSAQCSSCQVCYYCQLCDSGQCSVCESCDSCQSCVSCEATECGACVSCEDCYTVQCKTCQICNKCTVCYATQ